VTLARWIGSAVALAACHRSPGPELQVLGESTRVRLEATVPATSPWFDGERVTLIAARGETLGIQVLQRARVAVALELRDPAVIVRGYEVEAFGVRRPSTDMYGGSQGAGTYADGLVPAAAPRTNPAYFEIEVAAAAAPGTRAGELVVGDRRYPVTLEVADVALPELPRWVWSYGDPRELAWATDPTGDPPRAAPSAVERACIAMFRRHGVLLSTDLHHLDWWQARRELLDGFPYVPVMISKDHAVAAEQVRGWIEATRATGQVPFSIPIDEPRTAADRVRVRALAEVVRAAGGGPGRFLFAVTDYPHPEYGDAIDLYVSWRAAHLAGDRVARWTYNGAPPHAGSAVLDAETPGTRTWGWIAWRWNVPVWYFWDGLYWHDRHNRKGAPLPGRALVPRENPVSFDDGEDQGNFDGVLALPSPDGCQPTLRLASIRRGMQDRQLLELAARCDPDATARLAARVVPQALGDAPRRGQPSWSTDEADWEHARRELIQLASCPRDEPPRSAQR
jgi:hypothetical protein